MPRSERQKEWYIKNKDKVLAYNKQYQEENSEKRKEWNKKWYSKMKGEQLETISKYPYSAYWHVKDYAKLPHKYLIKAARRRAKVKNLPCDIDIEWCVENTPLKCPILGVELKWLDGNYSPSIDRIVPELGYIKSNCWVISTLANKMKWNSTREELLAFCEGILSLEKAGNLP
jgi:hypothetical protein